MNSTSIKCSIEITQSNLPLKWLPLRSYPLIELSEWQWVLCLPLSTEQYQEALEEGQDEPHPESELERTMEEAEGKTTADLEADTMPDVDGKPSHLPYQSWNVIIWAI